MTSDTANAEVDCASCPQCEYYSPHDTQVEHQYELRELIGNVSQGIHLQIEEEVVCVVDPESDSLHSDAVYSAKS